MALMLSTRRAGWLVLGLLGVATGLVPGALPARRACATCARAAPPLSRSRAGAAAPPGVNVPAPAPAPLQLSKVRRAGRGAGRGAAEVVAAPPLADACTNTTALYEFAKRLLQTHRTREAVAVLERLTALEPTDGRVWMKLMGAHKRSRRLKKAEEALRRGIKHCPSNALLRQALADLCRERKRYGEAREHFRRAMSLDPRMISVYDSWGRMEASLGQASLAATLFERGLALQPSSRLCHALGVLLDTQGETERARAVLGEGLRLPDEATNPQLLHALGVLEVRAGGVGAARAHFNAAVKEHPTFTLAYLSLGQLEERLGNSQAARRHYEAGATVPRSNGRQGAVQLWQSWARLEARLGSQRAALRLYERAVALFPEDAHLQVEMAKLASVTGDAGTARRLYEAALVRERPSPYAFQCAAALEQADGAPDAARALFERGAQLATADDDLARAQMAPLLHSWAVFEWRANRPADARQLFLRAEAASVSPCGWLFQWHARFETDQGRHTLARHYYARAVNASPRDGSAWRMWAELEAELGNGERSELFSRHAAVVETEAQLLGAVGGGPANPLSPRALYRSGP